MLIRRSIMTIPGVADGRTERSDGRAVNGGSSRDYQGLSALSMFLATAELAAARTVCICIARRYDTKLWMRDLNEGAAYLPK
jgi:hypothetical protein